MTQSRVEAVLQTGVTETPYFRAGKGSPVLLLFAEALEDSLGAELFERISERFRVLAPVPPAGVGARRTSEIGSVAIPVSKWLRDLIDGLGLVRPSVVVDEALAGALLGFFLMDRERVGRVVVVFRDHADPASPTCPLESGLAHSDQRLLVVAVDAAVGASIGAADSALRILPFLERDE